MRVVNDIQGYARTLLVRNSRASSLYSKVERCQSGRVVASLDRNGLGQEIVVANAQHIKKVASGTFFRRDRAKSRPALLDFFAATVRAEDLSLFVID